MTGTKTRNLRRRAAAINAAVSVSRSKGKYSAIRLPVLNIGKPATALAANLERYPCSEAPKERRCARKCFLNGTFTTIDVERRWRYPQMPFWTVAPDLSNKWG